jgi:glycosyltransferase involved in cell wall biosynthesis
LTRFGIDRFAENWRGIYERVKQPRILVLFGNVPLYGQERGNIEALDALRQTGCDALFLIREEWTRDTIQAELKRRGLPFVFVPYFDSVRHGVSLRVWWNNLKGIAAGSWQLLRQIRSFRATHIHAGSTANVLNFLPALLLTGLPLVFRAGDVPPQHHWLWRMVWRFTSRRAAHFVCDSRFIRDKLAAQGIEQDRTTVVYAPAPRRAASRVSPFPDEKASQTKMFTLLYVGQISQDKGVHLLIEAALALCRKRQDIRFVLAGDYAWNNPFGLALVERVNQAGLQNRIIFTGFVEDIDALYRQSNLQVSPSLCEEAYGLTVVEAKERGVPSIVFASGGLGELVRHGVDGCVCADKTADALTMAISDYVEHPDLAVSQGTAARESLAGLGIEHFADNWKVVYEKAGS